MQDGFFVLSNVEPENISERYNWFPLGTSLNKNITCQGKSVGFRKYSKEYENTNENNKLEKHRIVSEVNSSEYSNSPTFNFQLL